MIQEKDFLYRVPVKTAPITTPRGQIRNPEILVDLEGGEFMHGNILDANSTNKLISQSVKDAVDDKFIESGYVTKDLLEAETSARTKGDEDLHTALNQAITEKADASALANEVTRATGAESGLQAAITTKADATALSNYVLTTALNQQVDTLNAAISAKQDAGNYIPYDDQYKQVYIPDRTLRTRGNNIEAYSNGSGNDRSRLQPGNIIVEKTEGNRTHTAKLNIEGLTIRNAYKDIYIDKDGFRIFDATGNNGLDFIIQKQGITLKGGDDSHVLTSNSGTIDITQYALKTELPTVPTKTSQLTNDSNFITANHISDMHLGFEKDLKIYSEDSGNITTVSHTGINFETDTNDVAINEYGFFVSRDSNDAHLCSFTPSGIKFADKTAKDIPTADGTFINVNDLASADDVSSLRAGLSRKQNKITVNEVDTTDIETDDITKLRTIVTNLINALNASDLIRETKTLE